MKITTVLKAVKEDATPEQLCKQHNFGPGWLHAVKKVIAAAKKLDAKNIWGWCSVVVTVTVEADGGRFVGISTLGGCSYESETDFMKDDVYFNQLVDEATESAMAKYRNRSADGGGAPFLQPQPVSVQQLVMTPAV